MHTYSPASSGWVDSSNASGLHIRCHPGGSLFSIRCGDTLINQVLPTAVERGMHRLFLREIQSEKISGHLDVTCPSPDLRFARLDARTLRWRRETANWQAETILRIHPEKPLWVWQVRLTNLTAQARVIDLLYGQDLGLAGESAVRSNEAFTSQYIDHHPLQTPRFGTVVCSRQNMEQTGQAFPWLAQGCLTGATAFSTDGYSFFGLGHRLTGIPDACSLDRLPGLRQYECAYVALQTARITVPPAGTGETAFFCAFVPSHPSATGADDLSFLETAPLDYHAWPVEKVAVGPDAASPISCFVTAPPLAGEELGEDQWGVMFPGKHQHVERDSSGHRLAFFREGPRHVVSRRKELLVERPHGHLLRSGMGLQLEPDLLGCTALASGVFQAQSFLGNTNLARFLSVVRNPLDVMPSSGQRVFIRHHGEWRRLGVPSAFEMGLNDTFWLYQWDGVRVALATRVDAERPCAVLEIRVLEGPPCKFMITHLVVMGEREMDQGFVSALDSRKAQASFMPAPKTLLGEKIPGLCFTLTAGDPAQVSAFGGDELLFQDKHAHGAPYVVFQTKPTRTFDLFLSASSTRAKAPAAGDVHSSHVLCMEGLPRLSHPAVASIDATLPWFAQNAWMHLTAPHGLEQTGGAAWGVRDVCQGPVEWLVATRRLPAVRQIILQVFEQQHLGDGCWPQWFMFEPFRLIQADDAHGDVPFWPIKALCDYVEASNDFTLLTVNTPYTDARTRTSTTQQETILAHAMRVVDVYERRRIAGTALPDYGDGDWDDTLQPADPLLRTRMASTWTSALAYQAFRHLRIVCERAGHLPEARRLDALLTLLHADFQRLTMPGGVLAGFLVFDPCSGVPRPMLHPQDAETGIRYRLLPMTRAVIAELFTPEQALKHFEILRRDLWCPDGVRLMSDPVPYRGGLMSHFKRAETSACFGREIGLMYTHAHLRYAEALAKLGRADELWEALNQVAPVDLIVRVPHAVARQSNAYFTSSDGAFADRYEAARRFDELRDGRALVLGGWRVYSSGPGLFIHRVICGLLGIRESFGDMIFDPVLPRALDGLEADMLWNGRRVTFRYEVRQGTFAPRALRINGHAMPVDAREDNPYRAGGLRIQASRFSACLASGHNWVEIEM